MAVSCDPEIHALRIRQAESVGRMHEAWNQG